ncbi:MAG: class I SAM-dependent methyltransferase [Candidatus Pacebacteria bacterium]|nr:class I SAM-dependent methyltransferase [Candidatus Paceibacterota bacterium]
MSYYADTQYKVKQNLWFETIYFNRWFTTTSGPILDVGCATGNFVETHPEIIEGVEYDDDCLAACKERGLRVQKLDVVNQLDTLPEGKYAGVYAKQIIEHVPNPLYFLRNLRRTLATGGTLVVLTPNCPYALNRFFWDDYTHVRPLTKVSLARLALDAGFTDFSIYEDFRCFKGLGFLMKKFNITPLQVSAMQRFLRIPGLSLILEARK